MENKEITNQNNKTEGISIAGFILAFFFPLIGLILSIIGLSKANKNGSPKGVSIAGIILSILFMIIRLITIIAATFTFFTAVKSADTTEIESSVKCVASYGCKDLGNGTYECKYDSVINDKSEVIKCDKKYINEFNMRKENNDIIENNDDNLENNVLDSEKTISQSKINELYQLIKEVEYKRKGSRVDEEKYLKNMEIIKSALENKEYTLFYDNSGNVVLRFNNDDALSCLSTCEDYKLINNEWKNDSADSACLS